MHGQENPPLDILIPRFNVNILFFLNYIKLNSHSQSVFR